MKRNPNKSLKKINNDTYFAKNSGVLVTFNYKERADVGDIVSVVNADIKGGNEYKAWGKDNLLPNYREDILRDNNIMGSIMTTKRDIIIGDGIKPYIEEIIDGERKRTPVECPTEISDWMEESMFEKNYLISACNELLKHETMFTSIITTKDHKGIASVKAIPSKYMRIRKKVKGEFIGYLYSADWSKTTDPDYIIKSLPIYNSNSRGESVYHTGDSFLFDGYYYAPVYWGGKEWIELSNTIPKFHKANLRNMYTLNFHVKIPAEYFLDQMKFNNAPNEEEKEKCITAAKKAKQKFLDNLNKLLAGHENAGRTIHSTTELNVMLKEYVGIEIVPIKADLNDEALLKLYEKSNQANISSQAIHPTLANIESQGKLSSGSEMRNAFNFYVAVKTRTYRRLLLEVWTLILKRNGWDKLDQDGKRLKWGFEDITLAKLDDDKSGTESVLPNENTAA